MLNVYSKPLTSVSVGFEPTIAPLNTNDALESLETLNSVANDSLGKNRVDELTYNPPLIEV